MVVAAALTVFVPLLSPALPARAAPGPPNVVLILVDDARFDDLSTMPDVQSSIGDAGATLTSFYAPFPLCCPARATLLTGQYAHNHGVLSNEAPDGGFAKFEDSSTLATWLSPTYTTGYVGKYLNGYRIPYRPLGWEEWMVPQATYNYTYPEWSINTGTGASTIQYRGYQTDTIGQLAADFIARNAPEAEPFFLFTSIVAPHAGKPHEVDDPAGFPTPAVKAVYRDTFAGLRNANPAFNEADVSDKPAPLRRLSPAEVTALTEVNAQRRESLLSAEDAVMDILDALRRAGELNNSYVIFLSDNGYLLGEHRIPGGKVEPYQVSARVPMLVRGPGIAPGTVVRQLAAQIDVAPTVLAMTANAGAQGDHPIDGVDLLPLLTSQPDASLTRRAIVLEAGPAWSETSGYYYHAVRSGQWKYVEYSTGAEELYDLKADPHELENQAGQEAYAEPQARMRKLLEHYQWCSESTCR